MPVSEPGNMRPLINKIVNTKYGSVAVPQTTIPENVRAQYLFKCQTKQYRTSYIDTRGRLRVKMIRRHLSCILFNCVWDYLPDDLTPLNKLKYSITYTMNTHSASCHFG